MLGSGVDVAPALVLTRARDLFRHEPLDGGGELPVASGDMLFNVFDEYEAISDELLNSEGSVDTEGEFEEYNKCANDLLDTLGEYVPGLLRKESFFKDAFDC